MVDIAVENQGSIFLLAPLSAYAENWLAGHCLHEGAYQPYWPHSLVVEPRYVADIVAGARAAGLEVR